MQEYSVIFSVSETPPEQRYTEGTLEKNPRAKIRCSRHHSKERYCRNNGAGAEGRHLGHVRR